MLFVLYRIGLIQLAMIVTYPVVLSDVLLEYSQDSNPLHYGYGFGYYSVVTAFIFTETAAVLGAFASKSARLAADVVIRPTSYDEMAGSALALA